MKKYRVYLEFHADFNQPIDQLTLTIGADNHDDAFRAAMRIKDDRFSDCKLKNINIYEQ